MASYLLRAVLVRLAGALGRAPACRFQSWLTGASRSWMMRCAGRAVRLVFRTRMTLGPPKIHGWFWGCHAPRRLGGLGSRGSCTFSFRTPSRIKNKIYSLNPRVGITIRERWPSFCIVVFGHIICRILTVPDASQDS